MCKQWIGFALKFRVGEAIIHCWRECSSFFKWKSHNASNFGQIVKQDKVMKFNELIFFVLFLYFLFSAFGAEK